MVEEKKNRDEGERCFNSVGVPSGLLICIG